MAKGKTPDISRLNSYLEQIRSQLTECYQDLVVYKQNVTPEAIKNKFFGIEDSGESLKGLIEYVITSYSIHYTKLYESEI